MSELIKSDNWMVPGSWEQAEKIGQSLAKSTMIPKAYQGQPYNILAAISLGSSLGLNPMQAMQSIASVNGIPALYSDGMLAICRSCGSWEWMQETIEGEVATCTVKRRGEPEVTVTFSVSDAKRAKLWGKQGPWTEYPQRMLQMRARSWALRNLYADVLRGMQTKEEVADIPTEQPAVTVEPVAIEQAPAEPASKAQAVLSKAKAKRQPKPAAIPEVIEQPPQDAAELRITVGKRSLGELVDIGIKWKERYGGEHDFVTALRAVLKAVQDGLMDRIKDATSEAFIQIGTLDAEDQDSAAADMKLIMSAIEGATNAE
jgi:hypothetical protein